MFVQDILHILDNTLFFTNIKRKLLRNQVKKEPNLKS
jgi:hypothetical protein